MPMSKMSEPQQHYAEAPFFSSQFPGTSPPDLLWYPVARDKLRPPADQRENHEGSSNCKVVQVSLVDILDHGRCLRVRVFPSSLVPAVVATDLQETFQGFRGLHWTSGFGLFLSLCCHAIPGRPLSDSLGPRSTATVFLVIVGVGSLVFGLRQPWKWPSRPGSLSD